MISSFSFDLQNDMIINDEFVSDQFLSGFLFGGVHRQTVMKRPELSDKVEKR